MSAINEEEINEVLTKKESIEEVENDISTEPKTEPIEVIAEGENMEIIEEKKNSKEDLIDTNAIEESEQIATDYIDDVPQQDEMNIDNPEEMNDEPVLINDQPTLYNNEPMLINDQPTLYNNEPMLINDVKEDPEISHMKGGSKKTSQTQLGI
ncbi:hypothetical protein BCR36DRAFT_373138 [Piromyces finnis]|uniref:Uncharacterized protein n=1 Tax=Piromyces finnis TaxID=1754191 RepID=A0A1Y1V1T9_9FUNG|nr:hypothetical protein BCR36DRAFT_373138 [Piromyces finnis]|eukprot:ORX44663.1 hypothetical protein BCR36DRAFT_373138 [Piromyces finnis]